MLRVTALMVWIGFLGDDTAGTYPFLSLGDVLGGGAILAWMARESERPGNFALERQYLARRDCDRVLSPSGM